MPNLLMLNAAIKHVGGPKALAKELKTNVAAISYYRTYYKKKASQEFKETPFSTNLTNFAKANNLGVGIKNSIPAGMEDFLAQPTFHGPVFSSKGFAKKFALKNPKVIVYPDRMEITAEELQIES